MIQLSLRHLGKAGLLCHWKCLILNFFFVGMVVTLPAMGDSDCQRHLFHVPKAEGDPFFWYQENSWHLIESMDRVPSNNFFENLEDSLLRLDQQAQSRDWVNLLREWAQEGSSKYNLFQAERMIPSMSIFEDEDPLAIEGWKAAHERVLSWVEQGVQPDLEKLVSLNLILLGGPPDRAPFALRSVPESDDFWTAEPLFVAFNAQDVNQGMTELFRWYDYNKDDLHPVVLGALIYQRALTIHPFFDANGRTLRFLLDWILLLKGYPPVLWSITENPMHAEKRGWGSAQEKIILAVQKGLERSLRTLMD